MAISDLIYIATLLKQSGMTASVEELTSSQRLDVTRPITFVFDKEGNLTDIYPIAV